MGNSEFPVYRINDRPLSVTILLDPDQIALYQERERLSCPDVPGRYAMGFQGEAVFALRGDDVPIAEKVIDCQEQEGDVNLCIDSRSSRSVFSMQGTSCRNVTDLLAAIDGKTRLKDVCARLPDLGSPEQLTKLCQSLLGRAVFLPAAIGALEQGIRRVEIVRFPVQSPYLVLREYWSNCLDVRTAIPVLFSCLSSHSEFRAALADLHILATMGSNLRTYYGGSGGIPTIPGGYRTQPVRTGLAADKAKFIDSYLEGIGLRKLRRDDHYVLSGRGILLGAIAGDGLVFRHPPVTGGYLEKILEAMRMVLGEVARYLEGEGGDERDILIPLSWFHKLFLHAHPFYNINNSVAMNIVNYCLKEAGYGVIPHLLLDFIALRVGFDDYARVFGEAVENYAFHVTGEQEEERVLERASRYLEQLRSTE